MSNISLYHLKEEYSNALNFLLEMQQAGEIDEQTFLDTMAGLEGEVKEKSVNVAAYVRNLEGFAQQIKDAESNMKARRASVEKHAARLKTYLLDNMVDCGITEISCPEFDLKVKKTPPSVRVEFDAEIPEQYMVVKTTESPDKMGLKKALQSGEQIKGVSLESGYRLEVK